MDAKEIQILQKPIINAIEKLTARLNAMALLEMVKEFYGKEEREQLYVEYQQLKDNDEGAYATLGKAMPEGVLQMTHEERVAKFGDSATNALSVAHAQAMDGKRDTYKAFETFQNKHRLIVRLLNSKEEIGKNRFED